MGKLNLEPEKKGYMRDGLDQMLSSIENMAREARTLSGTQTTYDPDLELPPE
jgi:hypothetical protein